MKKTTNYKAKIATANLIAFVAYIIAALLIMFVLIALKANLGMIFIGSIFGGFILACPILLREENISKHFERKLREEKKARK